MTKHSPLPWRLEITDDEDRESGLVYAKVVDADGDTVFGQWSKKIGLTQANMAFLVEAVNRTRPLPDAELERLWDKIHAYGFLGDVRQIIVRVFTENERLLGLLDDLFRDHGANPDETPTVRVREENARLREAIGAALELLPAWSPRTSIRKVTDVLRKALGEGV